MLNVGADRILAGDSEIVVEISQAEVPAIALDVALLLGGLADSLSLVSGAAKLNIRVSPQRTTATNFDRDEHGRVECVLSRDNAEYIQATLLRAYRDGMAEVSHVHVDGKFRGNDFDLTLMFDTARPAMTPEEAERIMGR